MKQEKNIVRDSSALNQKILRMLDTGLEDVETGNVLSHREAMEEVQRIVDMRRLERKTTGAAANA